MKCPECDSNLSVIVTKRGAEVESRDLLCPVCKHRATSITFLIPRENKKPRGATSRSLLPLAEEGAFDSIKGQLAEMARRGILPDV